MVMAAREADLIKRFNRGQLDLLMSHLALGLNLLEDVLRSANREAIILEGVPSCDAQILQNR